jgi:hypothetical protein
MRCCVTGLPLHLRQCCIDNDVDALDSSLDGVDEATAMASVRAAAALNSVDVLRRLHGRLGRAALIHQDSNGRSALHWACMFDASDCVRYLRQHAVESATTQDSDGNGIPIVELRYLVTCFGAVARSERDAMSYACEFGHFVAVIVLGCRTNGPTADDEVRSGICCACCGW